MGQATVKFSSGALGVLSTPIGLNGQGTLEWDDAGLKLTGPKLAKAGPVLFGCLGFPLAMVLVIAIGVGLKLTADAVGTFAGLMGFVGMIGGWLIAKKLFPPKNVTLEIPWNKLSEFRLEVGRIWLVSKAKPKGDLYVDAEKTPLLYKEIHAFGLQRGAKI
ncbi:MAG: hypothetical protein K1X89_03540 [Myxococcaceae bacterium]|nr:hypothetical protein [Myxococcaceae bacterium]